MAKRRQCAKCGTMNAYNAAECKDCGIAFSSQQSSKARDPQTCAFDDHGHGCPSRGILSSGTTGEGAFFCREHFEVVNGRDTTLRGNEVPVAPTSRAIVEWRAKMGDRKVPGELPKVPRYAGA